MNTKFFYLFAFINFIFSSSSQLTDEGFTSDSWSAIDKQQNSYVAGVNSKSEITVNETLDEEELSKQLQDLYKNMELLKDLEAKAGGDREARTLLKKISFLTGLKLGSVLQSSGTLAASNSFRIFGKVINSALSISYGNIEEGVGVVGIPPVADVNAGSNILPYSTSQQRADTNQIRPLTTPMYGELLTPAQPLPYNPDVLPGPAFKTTPTPLQQLRNIFIKQHNQHVQRANQKFFKSGFINSR